MSKQERHVDNVKEEATRSHDVAYHRDDQHHAVGLLRALLAHDGHHTDPARIAELMAQRPADAHAMMSLVHRRYGASYARRVAHAMHGAREADEQNIDLHDYVPRGDSGTVGANGKSDPNRLTDHGVQATLAMPSSVYDSLGRKLGDVLAGQQLKVNAGAFATVQVPAAQPDGSSKLVTERCVFAFKALDGKGIANQFGWLPISALGDDAATKDIVAADQNLSKRLDRDREHDDKDFRKAKHLVEPRPAPDKVGMLHTMPNQTSDENLAKHYFQRPSGVVNLLLNVPGTGGSRFGVACDALGAGAAFHLAKHIPPAHVPLWRHGKGAKQTAAVLTFVYGYTVHQDGTKHYGWINQEMLGPVA